MAPLITRCQFDPSWWPSRSENIDIRQDILDRHSISTGTSPAHQRARDGSCGQHKACDGSVQGLSRQKMKILGALYDLQMNGND
jgi:hypothetical protein